VLHIYLAFLINRHDSRRQNEAIVTQVWLLMMILQTTAKWVLRGYGYNRKA